MPKLSTAWSKLRWSLTQRGLGGTLKFALERARRRPDQVKPQVHPFDARYGVDTGGLIGGGELRSGHRNDVFNTAYYGMAPSRFQWVMEYWIADQTHAALEDYSFVDLGCGKGRAVMMASEFRFRVVAGVELNAALAGIAEANVAVWTAAGLAVSRAGDWFGSPVNVASRVTGLARPGTVLVTDSARQSSGAPVNLVWVPAGAHRLRGVPGQVELFRVHRASR